MPPIETVSDTFIKKNQRPARVVKSLLLGGAFIVLILLALGAYSTLLAKPPSAFPKDMPITISTGWNPLQIAEHFESVGVVRSAPLLYWYMRLNHTTEYLQAGIYRFPEALTMQEVAYAITQGQYLEPAQSITIPEGFRISNLLSYLPDRYRSESITEYLPREGYLFPDTYFIEPDATLSDIITLLEQTYEERIAPLRDAIEASGFSESDIIILASILEREANDDASMREVAGILKHRLRIDMPLQVDAAFDYLLGKESSELTLEDLQIDSPFNTYRNLGLPPRPIANPGERAIRIAIEAPESPNLYYLTGTDGVFYYATTFADHVRNKQRYLR